MFKNRETKNSKKGEKEQRRGAVTDDEASFACERVCASDRLLKRMGGLAKVRRKKRAMREKRARISIVRFNPPPGDDDESGEMRMQQQQQQQQQQQREEESFGEDGILFFFLFPKQLFDKKVSIFVLNVLNRNRRRTRA